MNGRGGGSGKGEAVARAWQAILERIEPWLEAEKDQLPLWLPVGLILGVALWFRLPDPFSWIAVLLVSLSLGLAAVAFAGSTRTGRAITWFAGAAAIGLCLIWWQAERVAAPRLEREQLLTFSGRIDRVQPLAAERKVRLVIVPEGEAMPARLRVNVDEEDLPAGVIEGARVRATGWMMPPAPAAAPGGMDFSRTAWFQRIGGSGRAHRLELLEAAPPAGLAARFADWRRRLSAHVREKLSGGPEGGIGAALATGDQAGIAEADAEAMRRSGLTHLLSVSGLHLTAVVGAVMFLTLRLLGLSPWLALHFRLTLFAAVAGAAAGLFFTLLTGSEVPTVRACIAALLLLVAIAVGREALTLRLVATGAILVVFAWPESVAGPSFQLSFAAMVAIVSLHESSHARRWLSRRDEGWIAKSGRAVLGLLLTGLAVEIALAPIALFHFHRTGLYGAAANILAIPLTTFVIMPLEALALLFDTIGLGAPFWWATRQSLGLLVALAYRAAEAPGAMAFLAAMPRGAFAAMVGGGLWFCLWRTRGRLLGAGPAMAGALWAAATPAPDLLVTGDGQHLALRTRSGSLALLRPRAGDYVRDTLAELAGGEAEYHELESLPEAACSADLCAVDLVRGGRRWRILATRSPYFVRWIDMRRACASADIVVSDRGLPRGCQPRWLRADRFLLRRTGGLSISFGREPRLRTVAGESGRHPWVGFER